MAKPKTKKGVKNTWRNYTLFPNRKIANGKNAIGKQQEGISIAENIASDITGFAIFEMENAKDNVCNGVIKSTHKKEGSENQMTLTVEDAKRLEDIRRVKNALTHFYRERMGSFDSKAKHLSEAYLHTACGIQIALDVLAGTANADTLLEAPSYADKSGSIPEAAEQSLCFEIVKRRALLSGITQTYGINGRYARVSHEGHT